jgi:hypothetical protein
MERFKLKKLKEIKSKEQCRAAISKMFAVLEDFDAEVNNISA